MPRVRRERKPTLAEALAVVALSQLRRIWGYPAARARLRKRPLQVEDATMSPQTLNDLWTEARRYGRVRLGTQDSGQYYCVIEFNCIDHVHLEARSGFDCLTPEEALRLAICSARKIIGSLEEWTKKLPKRGLIA